MSQQKTPAKVVESRLSHREEAAYRANLKAKEPPLSPDKQSQLFELYLRGTSLEQIARVNSPHLKLGHVVRASVEGGWWERRELYVQGMLDGLRGRVQQVQGEAVDFLADFLAVFHKLYGDRFKRFLQTGDEKELGGMMPTNLGQYRVLLELMLKATGQGEKKTIGGVVQHTVSVESTTVPNPALGQPMTDEQAMQALFALHNKDTRS
jgi:hypothetical protein